MLRTFSDDFYSFHTRMTSSASVAVLSLPSRTLVSVSIIFLYAHAHSLRTASYRCIFCVSTVSIVGSAHTKHTKASAHQYTQPWRRIPLCNVIFYLLPKKHRVLSFIVVFIAADCRLTTTIINRLNSLSTRAVCIVVSGILNLVNSQLHLNLFRLIVV